MRQGGTDEPQFGVNDGTKEIRNLRNPFFPASLSQTWGSRGTLDNQDRRAGESNEGSYAEVVSENER